MNRWLWGVLWVGCVAHPSAVYATEASASTPTSIETTNTQAPLEHSPAAPASVAEASQKPAVVETTAVRPSATQTTTGTSPKTEPIVGTAVSQSQRETPTDTTVRTEQGMGTVNTQVPKESPTNPSAKTEPAVDTGTPQPSQTPQAGSATIISPNPSGTVESPTETQDEGDPPAASKPETSTSTPVAPNDPATGQVLAAGDDVLTLATAVLNRPSVSRLAVLEQAAVSNPLVWPHLAAMLLGRNSPGDASKAARLLEEFLRKTATDAHWSVRLLLVLARERETRALSRKGGCGGELAPGSAQEANPLDNELALLHKEIDAVRTERDKARHEVVELKRKLKDITSIEKSMDERKGH